MHLLANMKKRYLLLVLSTLALTASVAFASTFVSTFTDILVTPTTPTSTSSSSTVSPSTNTLSPTISSVAPSVSIRTGIATALTPMDTDGDGIADAVDALPLSFSNDFSDVGLGGTTTGSITNLGGQILSVREELAPAGVRVKADPSGGPTPATISACGGSAQASLNAGNQVVVTCGSVTIEVISGTVQITFVATDGTLATAGLNEGNSMTFEATNFIFTAPSTNSEPVVVLIMGLATSIDPGTTVVDTDGDRILDNVDNCPNNFGLVEFKGCTAAIVANDDLHVFYHKVSGFACIKDKELKNCKLPLQLGRIGDFRNEEVVMATKQIYRLDLLLSATGATSFDQIKPNCKSIFDNPPITALHATVNEPTGQELTGVPGIQSYVIIKRVEIKEPTNPPVIRITTTCKLVEPISFNIDSNLDGMFDTAKQKLKIMKTVKPTGIQLSPADDVIITGSQLLITYPTEALWEEGVNDYVYPYIFTSDSPWSVNVCTYAPLGYTIAGAYDEIGNLISDRNCVQSFLSGETKIFAFEVVKTGSPKKFKVDAEIDATHKGKPVKKVRLSTDSELVPKSKLVKEKEKGESQSPTAAFAQQEFIPPLVIALSGPSSAIHTAIIAILAGASYFALVRFHLIRLKGISNIQTQLYDATNA